MDFESIIQKETAKEYFKALQKFLHQERQHFQVAPNEGDVFKAFQATPYQSVKCVILGQDPYHGFNQADGLAFSVKEGVKIPPSLANLFKELRRDYPEWEFSHGNLTSWATKGILLLNTVLTVRIQEPLSHAKQGWEIFTDAIIEALLERQEPMVFVLLGQKAQEKLKKITADHKRHILIKAAHPSPLSYRFFKNSQLFLKINIALQELGYQPINFRNES